MNRITKEQKQKILDLIPSIGPKARTIATKLNMGRMQVWYFLKNDETAQLAIKLHTTIIINIINK